MGFVGRLCNRLAAALKKEITLLNSISETTSTLRYFSELFLLHIDFILVYYIGMISENFSQMLAVSTITGVVPYVGKSGYRGHSLE